MAFSTRTWSPNWASSHSFPASVSAARGCTATGTPACFQSSDASSVAHVAYASLTHEERQQRLADEIFGPESEWSTLYSDLERYDIAHATDHVKTNNITCSTLGESSPEDDDVAGRCNDLLDDAFAEQARLTEKLDDYQVALDQAVTQASQALSAPPPVKAEPWDYTKPPPLCYVDAIQDILDGISLAYTRQASVFDTATESSSTASSVPSDITIEPYDEPFNLEDLVEVPAIVEEPEEDTQLNPPMEDVQETVAEGMFTYTLSPTGPANTSAPLLALLAPTVEQPVSSPGTTAPAAQPTRRDRLFATLEVEHAPHLLQSVQSFSRILRADLSEDAPGYTRPACSDAAYIPYEDCESGGHSATITTEPPRPAREIFGKGLGL